MFRSSTLAASVLLSCLSLSPLLGQDPLTSPSISKRKHIEHRIVYNDASPFYKTWLNEDVVWIITDEEESAFKQLRNDEERDNFIQAFWLRRSPTPDAEENEFKEEHYRRIAYADERFGAGIPGWKTDRGRIYIMFGQPEGIEDHSPNEKIDPAQRTAAAAPPAYPRETWRYRYLEGIGENVAFEFIDRCSCGEYEISLEPSEREEMLSSATHPNLGEPASKSGNVKFFSVPPLRFPELALALEKVQINSLPFDVRTDFVRVTSSTAMVPITLEFKNGDLTFKSHDGIERAAVDIFGRVFTLTGRVVETFEDSIPVDVPHELLARVAGNHATYSHDSLLPPGRYKLGIAVKDANGERIGIWYRAIIVPEFTDKLAASSVILARFMEPEIPRPSATVPGIAYLGPGRTPSGTVIGDIRIGPAVAPHFSKPAIFPRDRPISAWMQVYNLQVEEKTHGPSASVEYTLLNASTNATVSHEVSSTDGMGPRGDEITLQKRFLPKRCSPAPTSLRLKSAITILGR